CSRRRHRSECLCLADRAAADSLNSRSAPNKTQQKLATKANTSPLHARGITREDASGMRRLYVEIRDDAFEELVRRALDKRRSARAQASYDLERLYPPLARAKDDSGTRLSSDQIAEQDR